MVEWKKLGEVCNVYDGTHQTPKYTDCGIKFVSVENIHAPYNSNKYISEDDYIKKYKTKPQQGDVLMTRIGDIGTCTVLNREEPIAYYVSLALLRPNQDLVQSNYVKYILESNTGKKELRKKTLLTAVPLKINLGDVGKISIPIPSLSEQSRIVSILDTFTSSISNLKQQIEERRKQYEYERDLLLNLEGKEGVERIPLKEVCDVINGRAYSQPELLDKGKYRVLRVGNFFSNDNWYYSDLDLEDKYYCKNGDLLYAWSASFGPHIWKEERVIYHYHIWKMECKDRLHIKYMYYWLQSKDMYKQAFSNLHGATMAHLTKALMESLKVSVPSLQAQSRIVSILDTFEQSIANLEEQLAMREKQYEYYRNQLLTFEGEEERGKT